ncbi:hypothetical protein A2765_01440 [Candidatus Kaiserbacteria bacterium RIFCSPHIGHO2_01_FULL_56_24]|uniref:Uncharacterized protein n=1 Tax=Candidatus Kaiserbacteria bacterium RIFCSPHIGHO2_01_FULL_56_24 TaxID=1798487 RepID=A0A1F6DHG5_9BACT|nr:MAG: hypothetical protein A2765_01440 [Candidatus Kaiserbacteria bacterium RIFCSPHIGHO2_01_FULL_56_24]
MQNFLDLSKGAKILLAACAIVVLAEGGYLFFLQTHVRTLRSTCQYVIAKWEKAEPDSASAKEKYAGPVAAVKFDGKFPEAKNFTSAITKAAAGGANFSGHYAVAEWGCGTSCQDHAVVDVQTGEIVAFGIPSEAGLSFNAGSSLLMTNPKGNFAKLVDLEKSPFSDQVYWFNVPREYYVLEEVNGKASVSRLCIESAYDGQIN